MSRCRALALGTVVLSCNVVLDIRDGTLRPPAQPGGVCSVPLETTGTLAWAENSASVDAIAHGVAAGHGAVVVTGVFRQDFSVGNVSATESLGFADMFIASYDSTTQALKWAKVFQGSGESLSYDVAMDAETGDVYMVGKFDGNVTIDGDTWTTPDSSSDAFIIKLDTVGDVMWAKQWSGGNYQDVDRVAVDAEGNVVVTGFGYGPLDVGLEEDIGGFEQNVLFLVKLDPNGNSIWGRAYQASDIDACLNNDWLGCVSLALATDAANNIYFAGGTTTALDSEPVDGGADVFVLKLDPNGTVIWDRTFGAPGVSDQWANAVAVDCSGNIYVAGGFIDALEMDETPPLATAATDPADAFLAQLDPNGNAVWSRAYGDRGIQVVTSLAIDSGDVVLGAMLMDADGSAGVSFGGEVHPPPGSDTGTYREDFAIAKLGADATFRWSRRFGDIYIQEGEVAAGEAGFVAAGDYYGSIKFDDTIEGDLTSPTAGRDFFVAAFNH